MKHELRKRMRQLRQAMSDEQRAAASAAVCRHAMELPAWKAAQRAMLFVPMPRSEPDIRPLLETLWAEGREAALPWFAESATETGLASAQPGVGEVPGAPSVPPPLMEARLVRSWGDLHMGLSGFMQPRADCPRVDDSQSLDFILVPGQAFDAQGGRLGRGRGDYDRFLPRTRPGILHGACFHVNYLQPTEHEMLPLETHDVPMDVVITERGAFGVIAKVAA
ncbi:hypothetical protein DB346_19585 [Verrucomicrobia bacterium LW23]|nr:hypothetical protein DB346_19585 [Verrucomicrobia bacterium LW23]